VTKTIKIGPIPCPLDNSVIINTIKPSVFTGGFLFSGNGKNSREKWGKYESGRY